MQTIRKFSTHFMRMAKINKPEALLKPINVPKKLLMGPGPSNCHPKVLEAGTLPLLGHLHPEFCQYEPVLQAVTANHAVESSSSEDGRGESDEEERNERIMDEVKLGLQYVFQTKNKVTLAVSGTGHCAMETAVINLLEPGNVALVAVNGIWGQRVSNLCRRNGKRIIVKTLNKDPGQVFSLSEIEEGLKRERPNVLFVCHSESSTGVLHPLENIGSLCKRYNSLFLVDAVASLGSTEIQTDDLGIDVIYSGSQKVLSCPPGVSLISFNDAAMSKVESRKTEVTSFYLDIKELANYWGCYDQPRRYHHTAPITSIYQLREALSVIAEEGLENVIDRHKMCSHLLYKGLREILLEPFVENAELRLPTVTTIKVPNGVNWKEVVDYCMKKLPGELRNGKKVMDPPMSASKSGNTGFIFMSYRKSPTVECMRMLNRHSKHN
ncbi:Serine--pyruvate aminotransferase, mitochondrial [Nymphon striatum]|nr:Serine--pyruvate aminotransferase, mitochondrial [Nymphon striatum]